MTAYQYDIISDVKIKFDMLSREARKQCLKIIEDKWPAVDRLARCLLLYGKVNGNFARYCFQGHEAPMKILDSDFGRSDLDRASDILKACEGLAIGPDKDEEAAWEATINNGIRRIR